jgi:hypothetical protein
LKGEQLDDLVCIDHMKTVPQRLILVGLFCSALTALVPPAHAQGGAPLWTNRYDGPGSLYDYASAIAVDRDGNVFVTGGSPNANTNDDYATIKYSNMGVPLWTNRYDGPDNLNDWASAIAVDNSGNVFVTGGSGTGNGSDDYATIKYSSEGVPLWTNRFDGPGNGFDQPSGLAVDSSGNVFVTGSSWNGNNYDIATIKYSNAGVAAWTNYYDGPASLDDLASAIVVDGNGNVFVTGGSRGVNGVNYHYVTIKYSGAGVLLWINPCDLYETTAIAVDGSGNVFVTGSLISDRLPDRDGDYATIKYSNAGVPLWTNLYNNSLRNGADGATAIAVDSSGNVFVTGESQGTDNNAQYATIKYSNAGVPLWTNRFNAYIPRALAVDSSGNVFVTGNSYSPGSVTVAYSKAGAPLWTNRFNGDLLKIAVDRNGNVFVIGSLPDGAKADYVTIKYSSSVPPPRLDFQKVNNKLVLSWTNAGFYLQSAATLTGPFTNVPNATSPYTNTLTAPRLFFRLTSN